MKKAPPFFLTRKFMGIFFAVIMLVSIAGVFTGNVSEEEPRVYNNYRFYPYTMGWFTYINEKRVPFEYLPEDLSNITSIPYITIDNPRIYLIHDPLDKNISYVQPQQRLASLLLEKNIVANEACSQEKDCPLTTPIKSCEDIPIPAVFFKQGTSTRIYKDYMCYVIEADSSLNMYKATEKLIYQLLGVI